MIIFHGVGESTTDLHMGTVRGIIPEGVAILWHKKHDPLISVIRCGLVYSKWNIRTMLL